MLINLRHLRAVVLNTFGVCRAVRRFRAAVECGRWDARVGKRQCAMREAPTRDCEGLARARPFAFVEYTTHAGVLTGTPGTCLHSGLLRNTRAGVLTGTH